MNFNQNPNPNWINFPAKIDPPMDFELSDYLVLEEGVDQLDWLSSQSFPSSENFATSGGAGGSSETSNMSGATSRNTNMQVIIVKPTNFGLFCYIIGEFWKIKKINK